MEQSQDQVSRQFTPDQKFKIIKEQMTTKTSVTEIGKNMILALETFISGRKSF